MSERTVTYHEDGVSIKTEEWFLDGIRHRTDGPAYIEYSSDSDDVNVNFKVKEWYIEGKRHRIDGPAVIQQIRTYNSRDWSNNIMIIEEWFFEDERHREDGPAYIQLINNTPKRLSWHINGNPLDISPYEHLLKSDLLGFKDKEAEVIFKLSIC